MAFNLKRKKQLNDWSAGILACPIAKQSKRVLITIKIEGNQNLQFAFRNTLLRFVCYTLRQARMPALQSFNPLFPQTFFLNYKR
jgi:hypothetical protein